MACVTIRPEDVKKFYDTTVSDFAIQVVIDMVNAADQCLEGLAITDDQIKAVKLYSIAHLLQLQEGGQTQSETDMDGASVTYAIQSGGEGFGQTTFGRVAQSLPGYECISAVVDKPKRFAGSVGYKK